ncbi:DUF5069 domain-containing protein [Patescibacteria group bacterium]|nr:MAG: DUF5069 domain-containing protein [Patescibacteria group bacterium]
MSPNKQKIGLDLTKHAPRSPRVKIGHFVILARIIDKCRALLWGNIGEYDFNCELDQSLLEWKGLIGEQLKTYIAEGHSDEEIADWIKSNGIPKTDAEIVEWAKEATANTYADDPEGREWLDKQIERLGLVKDATVFDYLDADDMASFNE